MDTREHSVILVAEDDLDDQLLIKESFKHSILCDYLFFVGDGEELMDYLHNRNAYEDADAFGRPALILLDLNMPRKDGREALAEIKGNPGLKGIPVVILTTSHAEEDVARSYDVGANSYIVKPMKFEALVDLGKELEQYWFKVVELPLSYEKKVPA